MKTKLQHRPLSSSDSPTRIRGHRPESGNVSTRRRTRISSHSHNSDSKKSALTLVRMERLGQVWLLDGQARFHSPKTTDIRATALRNLVWFMRNRYTFADGTLPGAEAKDKLIVDSYAMRSFLVYLREEDPLGKWGTRNIAGKSASHQRIKGALGCYLRQSPALIL